MLENVQIGRDTQPHAPIGLGCSFYGVARYDESEVAGLLGAMAASLEGGITHFDTAHDYGAGKSERLIGRFLAEDPSRRDQILLASKANLKDVSAVVMQRAIDLSRQRLGTDIIDIYYIHWPITHADMRPWAEALESARRHGQIRAIGLSNFSIAQIEQVAEVAQIDALQLGYNLLWRFPEVDLIPYCHERGISVIAYSALASGILAGMYQRRLSFAPHDQRWGILHFRDDIWGALYPLVEQFNAVAARVDIALSQLALRWILHQPGVTAALVSAKNRRQAQANCAALEAEIDVSILEELSAISDEAMKQIPDEGNPFGYHP